METPAVAPDARKGLMRLLGVIAAAAALAACAPADPAATLAQNLALCESQSYSDQRIAACSALITDTSLDPARRATALVRRGMLRAELGQHARAVADFGRALRLDATNTDAYSERGAVHQQRGAFDLAVRDYDAALALDPRHSIAAYRREEAVRGRSDAFSSQLAQLSEILTRDPENVAALNNRCWLRATYDQDINAALADCDAAVRADPRYGAAFDSRGLVHLKRHDFQEAVADYDAALRLEPTRGHYLYGRGLARLQLGQSEQGEADLVAAEAAEPGVAQAYAGYGYLPPAPSNAPDAAQALAPAKP
jgi:tetratricopeptide (TPR) repeat protein